MLDMAAFGERLRMLRCSRGLTQRDVAAAVCVSEQAVSKWEHGAVLPDAEHLLLLGRTLRISVDALLGAETGESLLRTIRVGGACFALVRRPETILAGCILYARDYESFGAFDEAIGKVTDADRLRVLSRLEGVTLPAFDIHLSVNFWRPVQTRAYGFVREVTTAEQPEGVQVYRMPESLYLRARNDVAAAQLIARKKCEMWELFAYMREYVMPSQRLAMADNGAQELEVCDAPENGLGWAYIPVKATE